MLRPWVLHLQFRLISGRATTSWPRDEASASERIGPKTAARANRHFNTCPAYSLFSFGVGRPRRSKIISADHGCCWYLRLEFTVGFRQWLRFGGTVKTGIRTRGLDKIGNPWHSRLDECGGTDRWGRRVRAGRFILVAVS